LSRGDHIRSGQEKQETQKVVKESQPEGFAARKGFWLLLAHKSNQANWETVLVIDKRHFPVLVIGEYFIIMAYSAMP
jgi:hypothetical protein